MTDIVRTETGIVASYTPTVTAGIYSAKDAVGEVMSFANAVRRPGGTAKIVSVVMTDLSFVQNVLEVWFYDRAPTAILDNGVFDPLDPELPYVVGVVAIAAANYFVATDNQVAVMANVGIEYTLPTGTTLYAQCKCVGTPTYASTTDLVFKVGIEYLN